MEPLVTQAGQYLKNENEGIFLEIGSDRMEGSTLFLANLAEKFHTELLSVDITSEPQTRIQHSKIQWHVAKGSEWCRDVWPKIAQPILLLYLDNFDYDYGNKIDQHHLWNPECYNKIKGPSWPQEFTEFANLPGWIQEEVKNMGFPTDLLGNSLKDFYHVHGLVLDNNQCQIEHFLQMRLLFPYLTDYSVICFDDTYLYNGCWIGKNGPNVIFLQSHGYHIIQRSSRAVIMMKDLNG